MLNNLELEQIIDQKLNSNAIADYAPNGLQVEGRQTVKRIITGVTATLPLIEKAIEKGHVEYAGDELDKIIPAVSRRGGAREQKKLTVLEKIRKVVEVFIGI